ncbi:MAG: class I SAM-dependent methyltransferase, partial [Pseudomonadota bacterium]
KRYFRRVHQQLAADGILFLDAYGGYDSFRDIEEEREIEDGDSSFTYVWEQEKYEPISGDLICHIHFDFADGSRLEKAFSYDWRLWTLPEIGELLAEAGFSRVTVYWQGFDEAGEADGIFEAVEEGDADAGWICYLTAEK